MVGLGVFAAVVLLTFPFGWYRASVRNLSARWFLAIHVPVPFVFLVRTAAGLPLTFIPLTCLAFAAGQILGSRAARWWRRRPEGTPASAAVPISAARDEPESAA
jgi:uncharacterized membrane protein